jgi:hypothetical protein
MDARSLATNLALPSFLSDLEQLAFDLRIGLTPKNSETQQKNQVEREAVWQAFSIPT